MGKIGWRFRIVCGEALFFFLITLFRKMASVLNIKKPKGSTDAELSSDVEQVSQHKHL